MREPKADAAVIFGSGPFSARPFFKAHTPYFRLMAKQSERNRKSLQGGRFAMSRANAARYGV